MMSTVTVTVSELVESYQRSVILLENLSKLYIAACLTEVNPDDLHEVAREARELRDELGRIVES